MTEYEKAFHSYVKSHKAEEDLKEQIRSLQVLLRNQQSATEKRLETMKEALDKILGVTQIGLGEKNCTLVEYEGYTFSIYRRPGCSGLYLKDFKQKPLDLKDIL